MNIYFAPFIIMIEQHTKVISIDVSIVLLNSCVVLFEKIALHHLELTPFEDVPDGVEETFAHDVEHFCTVVWVIVGHVVAQSIAD